MKVYRLSNLLAWSDENGFILLEPISAEARNQIEQILENSSIDELAAELNVDRGVIWRLRKKFGVAKEYSGESRTTQWRRAKPIDSEIDSTSR